MFLFPRRPDRIVAPSALGLEFGHREVVWPDKNAWPTETQAKLSAWPTKPQNEGLGKCAEKDFLFVSLPSTGIRR